MNFIQRLLGLRQAKQDDHAIMQATARLKQMQATIAALAHPTEPIEKPNRRAG